MSTFEVTMVQVDIEPHDNADALEVAKIRGTDYVSVVPKGKYQTDDSALYIPEQAIVPEWILEELGLVGKLAGSKKNRIKAMSLRGVFSQGILYKPSPEAAQLLHEYWDERTDDMDPYDSFDYLMMNADWAPALGIEKWVPEVPVDMAGIQYAPDAILPYTEIDDIKKYPNILQEGEDVVITEKIHGTCAIYHFANGVLHVSSKGVAKKGLAIEEDPNNLYWKVANSWHLKDRLTFLSSVTGQTVITLFGEIYGVQDLKYGKNMQDPGFRAFDIAYAGQFQDFETLTDALIIMGVECVPVLYTGPFYYHHLQDFANGKELVSSYDIQGDDLDAHQFKPEHIREGVVVKPVVERRDGKRGRVIFKYVSPDYLNRKGDTTEYE